MIDIKAHPGYAARRVFDLPLPTSTNRLHHKGGARVFRSGDYAAWIKEAGLEVIVQRSAGLREGLPAGAYTFAIAVNPKDAGDIDNRIKAALDLLVRMSVTADDKNNRLGAYGTDPSVKPGRCRICVMPGVCDLVIE